MYGWYPFLSRTTTNPRPSGATAGVRAVVRLRARPAGSLVALAWPGLVLGRRNDRKSATAHRVQLPRMVSGAGWLNHIESHLTAVREFVLNNTDYRSHRDLQAAVRRYVAGAPASGR